jgi:hypothetical protein
MQGRRCRVRSRGERVVVLFLLFVEICVGEELRALPRAWGVGLGIVTEMPQTFGSYQPVPEVFPFYCALLIERRWCFRLAIMCFR